MNTKVCNRCKNEKLFDHFRLHKTGKYGLYGICKECEKEQAKEIYRRPVKKEKLDAWRTSNLEHINEAARARYWQDPDKNRATTRIKQARYRANGGQKRWKEANKEHLAEYESHKRKTDSGHRAAYNARNRVAQFLKGKVSFSRTLGCSKNEFVTHVEKLFQPGMTWDNYGLWEVDHKIPLYLAYLDGPESFATACLYTNLQPLWKVDHDRKTAEDIKLIKAAKISRNL